MTETATEAKEPTFANAMQKMQFDGLVELTREHNELVAKINAATGDKDSLAESIRESDEFEDLRNQIAELEDRLDAQVNAKVEEALAGATEDTTEIQEQVKELKSTLTAGLSFYKKLYNDDTVEALPKVDRLKGTRSGGGGGGKRIRGYNVIVDVNGETTEYENFASAAKALGVGTAELQEQFYARAGVEKLKDAPDEVSFGMQWIDVDEDENETTVNATVKAYRTGPSGPPEKSDDSDASDEASDEEPSDEDLEEI